MCVCVVCFFLVCVGYLCVYIYIGCFILFVLLYSSNRISSKNTIWYIIFCIITFYCILLMPNCRAALWYIISYYCALCVIIFPYTIELYSTV